MRRIAIILALLMPSIAYAQPVPDVSSQADAATVQGTRILSMLDGQITSDQAQIKSLQSQVADLQKQLDAAKAPKPEATTK